ncbi:uncharacterized protein LOC141660642 [Apium graveolens]|uniref:uncharacterized protein LOC141660642 n=1 Tax=Apium graveolens TaxID=4045 RepID=UPI003D7AFF95
MMYQGIPENVLLSIAENKSVKAAWEVIKTLCQGAEQVKKAQVQTLKTEFEALCMNESDQLDDFYLKLNGLASNIRALGEEIKESYIVKKLLRAMPTRFLQITSTIEQFGDLDKITVKEAMGSLKAHDERIKGNGESTDSKLLLTEEEWRKRESNESKLLFTREEWQNRSNKTNDGKPSFMRNRDKCRVRCFNCSLYGHFASECRKLK